MVIYFTLCLSIFIMGFMRIVCIMVFMQIVSVKIFIFMKRDVLRFVSMLFSIFEKGDEQKNCVRFFKICKYSFLIFEKGG